MAYLTIEYSTAGTRANVDFLHNPKGYNVKNNFGAKKLTGTVTDSNKGNFVSEYIKLNPKFPAVRSYNSDANGNQISNNTVDTNLIPTNYEKKESQNNDNMPLIIVGILAVGAFIFFKKKKKRR